MTAGMEVSGEAFPHIDRVYIERVRVLANPPACPSCELHASVNNSHYCGFEVCAKRKQAAWVRKEIGNVTRTSGVPLYQPEDGECVNMFPWRDEDVALFTRTHADLRLSPSTNEWNNFEGLPNFVRLVAVGELAASRKVELV